MNDPAPQKSLAYRDALFWLRAAAPVEYQKRIDDAVLASVKGEMKAGKPRQGRHSVDKMLTAIGAGSGAMLVEVLSTADAPYLPAAEMLGKVGDEPTRDKGAAALIARAPQIHAAEKSPEKLDRAVGIIGGPSAVRYLEHEVSAGKPEDALIATRALAERRDPTVLPFALKLAADPKANKALRDEMFGVVETIGGLRRKRGCWASSRPTRKRSSGTGRSRPSWARARPTGLSRGWRRSRPAPRTRRSMSMTSW